MKASFNFVILQREKVINYLLYSRLIICSVNWTFLVNFPKFHLQPLSVEVSSVSLMILIRNYRIRRYIYLSLQLDCYLRSKAFCMVELVEVDRLWCLYVYVYSLDVVCCFLVLLPNVGIFGMQGMIFMATRIALCFGKRLMGL